MRDDVPPRRDECTAAHRFQRLERTKCKATLPRLNDQNNLDGNIIIGPGAAGLANFHMLAGFSGHGPMHTPACRRPMAELIINRRYEMSPCRN